MEFKVGEKYKSYSLFDYEKTGDFDVFEVVVDDDGELAFFNYTEKQIYDLNFLGHSELVKIVLEKGSKVRITTLLKKDFNFTEEEFDTLSSLVNGQEGIVLSHNKELEEFGERESYQILVNCQDGVERNLEIELDEFIII